MDLSEKTTFPTNPSLFFLQRHWKWERRGAAKGKHTNAHFGSSFGAPQLSPLCSFRGDPSERKETWARSRKNRRQKWKITARVFRGFLRWGPLAALAFVNIESGHHLVTWLSAHTGVATITWVLEPGGEGSKANMPRNPPIESADMQGKTQDKRPPAVPATNYNSPNWLGTRAIWVPGQIELPRQKVKNSFLKGSCGESRQSWVLDQCYSLVQTEAPISCHSSWTLAGYTNIGRQLCVPTPRWRRMCHYV